MKTDIRNGLLAHAAALILLHLALMTPPSILSHKKLALYVFPLILACNIYSWQMNLGFLAVVQGLWAGELLLFKNPREDFKLLHFERARSKNKTGVNKEEGDSDSGKIKGDKEEKKDADILPWGEPFPSSIYQRFWWVLKLTQSLRYTSWDTGSTTTALVIPQSSSSTKAQMAWLVNQLGLIGICLLILDTTNLYMHYDPYFQITTAIDETLPRRLSTFLSSYYLNVVPPRAIRILVLGSQQYAIFSLVGCIPAVLMVVLGWVGVVSEFYSRKENYLPVMGNPLVVLDGGLRGFWGKFWHQILREIFLGPGRTLSRLFGIPDGSVYAYAFQVFIAFGISGFVHAVSLPNNIQGVSPLRYALFFWEQSGFVLAEIAVGYIFRAKGREVERNIVGKIALRTLRLVWTLGVLYYTLPVVLDQLVGVTRIMGLSPVIFLSKLTG